MKRKPNKGQRYFPNSCEAIRNTPDKYFGSMSYEQFEDLKIYGYQIPDSVFAIIRMKNEDGKYTEKFYNTERGAKNCIAKGMNENQEITMCTMEGMYFLKPDDFKIDFNNDK
jgi:hypothetical protein